MKIKHLLTTVVFTFITMISWSQGNVEEPLTKFTLESDNDYWVNSEETRTVNLVSYFKAISNANEEHKRFPLNLSIVIDRSGSMEGQKLAKTKEAVTFLLKQLEPGDIVSVVSYESSVEVVIPPQRVDNHRDLVKKIEKIESDGGTFLSGGLEQGYELISTIKDTLQDSSFVHRVILLSDGLANEGIVDPQSLQRIASDQLEENDISLSTIGVGGDYNEELMTSMAIKGTGNYYFVETAVDIPKIFEEELNGVQSLVTKNTTLAITFPEEAVKLRQVHHYNYSLVGNTISFQLSDVFSANEKAFLLEFDVRDGYSGDLVFSAQLDYQNALREFEAVTSQKEFTIQEAPSESDFKKSYRQLGSLAQTFMLSMNSYTMATKATEEGNFNEAESLLQNAIDAIKVYNGRFDQHPFLQDISDEIKAYKKTMKEMQKKPKRHRNLINRRSRYSSFRSISCPSF